MRYITARRKKEVKRNPASIRSLVILCLVLLVARLHIFLHVGMYCALNSSKCPERFGLTGLIGGLHYERVVLTLHPSAWSHLFRMIQHVGVMHAWYPLPLFQTHYSEISPEEFRG